MSQPSENIYIGPGGISYSDGTLIQVYTAIVTNLQDSSPISGNGAEIEMINAEASYQKNL